MLNAIKKRIDEKSQEHEKIQIVFEQLRPLGSMGQGKKFSLAESLFESLQISTLGRLQTGIFLTIYLSSLVIPPLVIAAKERREKVSPSQES